jgi:hypothetical protein
LGLAVWFDKENVVAGEEWRSAREKAQDAADLVIHVILSEVLTRSGEVQRELKRTLDLAKEKPSGYFEWRRSETTTPETDAQCSTWQCQAREFFRSEQILSLLFEYFTYWSGAAHGNTGTATMNFAGENVGKFELSDLFNRDLPTLKFLLDYVRLGVRQHILTSGDDGEPTTFLADFDEYLNDPDTGWTFLGNFNFDRQGLILHFDPYSVLPFVYGTVDIRLDWDRVWSSVAEEFKKALGPALKIPGYEN